MDAWLLAHCACSAECSSCSKTAILLSQFNYKTAATTQDSLLHTHPLPIATMSFQFVHVNPDKPEHDAESRRRIRSQAMRDYRRRQRMEEDYQSSSREGSPSSLSSPQRSSAGQSREESRHRRSSTQSLPVKTELLRRQSSGTSREELPSIEDLELTKGKRRSSQPTPGDEVAESSRKPKQRRPDRPRAQHGTFSTFSINLPKRKKTLTSLSEDIDPLSSPGQLDQMLSICESYNRWLIANSAADPAVGLNELRGPWDNQTSQMLLFALTLKSIGHLDALQSASIGGNRRLFKTRVLALANKRLKNPAKALEDKTIGALACLTSYEVCYLDRSCGFWHSRADVGIDITRVNGSYDAFEWPVSNYQTKRRHGKDRSKRWLVHVS